MTPARNRRYPAYSRRNPAYQTKVVSGARKERDNPTGSEMPLWQFTYRESTVPDVSEELVRGFGKSNCVFLLPDTLVIAKQHAKIGGLMTGEPDNRSEDDDDNNHNEDNNEDNNDDQMDLAWEEESEFERLRDLVQGHSREDALRLLTLPGPGDPHPPPPPQTHTLSVSRS
jgi:hypothetical protein